MVTLQNSDIEERRLQLEERRLDLLERQFEYTRSKDAFMVGLLHSFLQIGMKIAIKGYPELAEIPPIEMKILDK